MDFGRARFWSFPH